MSDNSDKTVLITGATGGMGAASALLAAERGYNLILSDLNGDKLRALAQQCSGLGVTVSIVPMDITDASAVQRCLDTVAAVAGLAGVIHTVGLSPHMAAWDKIISVDLIATVGLIEALRPALQPGAAAVCITSMSGHMVPPNPHLDGIFASPDDPGLLQALENLPGQPLSNSGVAYAYAKRALINYVKSHAANWGSEGKRLLSISPGLIDTDMGRLEAESDADGYATMRPLIPLQRDGVAREIATAALFLVSPDASYISGIDLLVDGGFVAAFQQIQGAQAAAQ